MVPPTVFLPLQGSSAFPDSPSFLRPSSDPGAQLSKLRKTILKAKRIVIVCGAGISVHAGIPDFRSSEGLFQSLKRDNPKEVLSSGRDLFDASVFNSENTTALFYQMIGRLSELSQAAAPTPFHCLLRTLDTSGKLLRVYTQNIDAIEVKSGLSFGVPPFDGSRRKYGKRKCSIDFPTPSVPHAEETPRCIPLHGTLQTLHCQTCNYSFPLDAHLPSLTFGIPPDCPECTAMEATRQLVGKRARGVGRLRPSVVLYNESHKDGEGVGEVVRRDLVGSKGRSGADLLLVVGTSLRVPGTKRIVREFAKAVHARASGSGSGSTSKEPFHGLLTPLPSPRRSPTSDDEPPIKSIYLNLDFPVPTREWEGVFDVWVQGDAQELAEMLIKDVEEETRLKEVAFEKKRRREEEDWVRTGPKAKKRTVESGSLLSSLKHRKTVPRVGGKHKGMPHRTGEEPKIVLRIPSLVTPPSTPRNRFIVPEVVIKQRRASAAPASPRAIESPVDDALSDTLVRTIQYGLRNSAC